MYLFSFFFNDTATTEIYTLSLHDALPICAGRLTARVDLDIENGNRHEPSNFSMLLVRGALQQTLKRRGIEGQLRGRCRRLDLWRVREDHHPAVRQILEFRPAREPGAIGIAVRDEVDPVRRHLVGEAEIDLVPRLRGLALRVVPREGDLGRVRRALR